MFSYPCFPLSGEMEVRVIYFCFSDADLVIASFVFLISCITDLFFVDFIVADSLLPWLRTVRR